jgi:hypothetical protein
MFEAVRKYRQLCAAFPELLLLLLLLLLPLLLTALLLLQRLWLSSTAAAVSSVSPVSHQRLLGCHATACIGVGSARSSWIG